MTEDKAMSGMNEIVADRETSNIVTRIEKMRSQLPSTPSDRILTRVSSHLRRVKNKAFEPDTISIGPFHRGQNHLAAMEEHKFRYLNLLLRRRDESSVAKYVEALMKLNERAKNSYEERFLKGIKSGVFLETMLVDGCFIVELIRKGVAQILRTDDNDPIFRSEITLYSLKYDLLLLENQLPFFILEELFHMTLTPGEERDFVKMIFNFFNIFPGPGYAREHNLQSRQPHHLLGLVHDNWLPSRQGLDAFLYMDGEKQTTNDANAQMRCATGLDQAEITLFIDCGLICGKKASKEDYTEAHIRCATELHQAGIKFKKAEGEDCSIFDIKFANGIMEIPKLSIEDRTESLLKNLIAYEHFWGDKLHHAIDYARFMDCLINSNKDVELLCRSGIIENWLGDHEVVARMFNRLLDNVRVRRGRSLYSEISVKVNMHCGREWNVWKAKLRHDYFNSPWALISFLAAVFLLLFTVLQAVYSVLSYHHL